jgi:dolichyl-phosphate-mannose-protein mannosyltransferase
LANNIRINGENKLGRSGRINLHLGFTVDKKDVLIIVILSIVFLAIALPNLGYTQVPTTTVQLSDGQSFYVDLGGQTAVKSVVILLKGGNFNVTISKGSPNGWNVTNSQVVWPSEKSEDYYKWDEISVGQTTQYLKFDFGQSSFSTVLVEVAVIDQNKQQVTIQSVANAGAGSPDVQSLIDEQSLVHYPLDYMSQTYFDEIYFVRTAEQYLHLQYPYEWTHPPLGKLIQASGIVIFGYDPFGWRIMGVIFATLMIAFIYLLGKELLGSWIGGFAAAFLLTFDFMHFTMGRMGTADTYVVFFSVASQLFYFIYLRNVLKDGWKTSTTPLILSIILFALSFSTKWLVLYGFLGELAILIVLRLVDVSKVKGSLSAKVYVFLDHPYLTVTATLLLAVGIYFATYIPDMMAGRSIVDVLNLQGGMYDYHAHLTATHPFASPWYSWPLLYDPVHPLLNMIGISDSTVIHVPVWLQSASLPDGLKSTIVLMGNPAVWWIGLVAMFSLLFFSLSKVLQRNPKGSGPRISLNASGLKEYWFPLALVTVFFFQWLPYAFITRVIFIYHFYLCVPLLCLASAFFISKYWDNRWVKVLTVVYFAVVVALFVLFYPVISGVPTTQSTIDSLHWNKSWVF